MINGSWIQWYSKQQSVVALSTIETDYVAASTNVQECLWIRQLLHELKLIDEKNVPELLCDNQSATKNMSYKMLEFIYKNGSFV